MNIHEHQAKQLLKKFGAIVPNGEACFSVQEVLEKAKKLNLKKYVLKAQIHAGGRGKACLLYTSPSPRDGQISRMPSSA